MINYMKSEIYKVTRSKITYLYLSSFIVLMIALSFIIKLYDIDTGLHYDAGFLLELVRVNAFNIPLYLTILITGLVFTEEYKNKTMSNTISYGFTRAQIYFGKFIVQVITAIVFASIVFGSLIASSYLILGFNGSNMASSFNLLFIRIMAALPLWLAALAIANALAFIFTSTMAFSMIFMVIIVFVPSLIDTISLFTDKLDLIKKYMLSCQLAPTNYIINEFKTTSTDIKHYYFLGFLYLIAAVIIGYNVFRKKEIK